MQLEFCKMCAYIIVVIVKYLFCETLRVDIIWREVDILCNFSLDCVNHYNPSKISNAFAVPTGTAVVACVNLDCLHYLLSANCRALHGVPSLTC